MTGKPALVVLFVAILVVAGLALAVVFAAARLASEEFVPPLAEFFDQAQLVLESTPTPTASPVPASPTVLHQVVGRVSSAATGNALPRVVVQVLDGDRARCCVASTVTDSNGTFTISLASGTYRFQFVPPIDSGNASQYWRSGISYRSSTNVTVPRPPDGRVDMALSPGFLVSGAVMSRASGSRVGAARLDVWTTSGDHVIYLTADVSGRYAVRLPNGSYSVRFYPPGQCCSGEPASRAAVEVSDGDRAGVDGQLP